MKKIRTLIVDDEPLARERLAGLLSNEADIEVVAQCRRRSLVDDAAALEHVRLVLDGRCPI
jgi:DNA-binding NarL/FixJ family response regulator